MNNIIADQISSLHGNFNRVSEKTFIDVLGTSFKQYTEKDFPTKKNNLDLVDGRVKVLIEGHSSPFHYITGIYGAIANALEMFENPLFIINTSKIQDPYCSKPLVEFLYFFLQDNEIDYLCVNSEEDLGFFIDNFYVFPFGEYPIPNAINKIHNMFLKYVEDKSVVPYKKVYISRRKVNTGIPAYAMPDDDYLIRIDDEIAVEDFFKSMGFEVVYPEDFKSLRDQINYFYSVKTLASISGGGALNLIFMQNNSNVVEIISPLFSGYGEAMDSDLIAPANWVIAHHNFFSNISFKRNLNYVGISSPEKRASVALGRIINSRAAMSIIEEANHDNA